MRTFDFAKLSKRNQYRVMNYPIGFMRLIGVGGAILAGGAVRSIFDKSEIADYDFFFPNRIGVTQFEERLLREGAERTFNCPLGELQTWKFLDKKLQLITHRFYEGPEDLLSSFDIGACQMALTFREAWTGDAFGMSAYDLHVHHSECIRDAKRKRVRFNAITAPIASVRRIHKYEEKGYYTSDDEFKRFFDLVRDADPDEIDWRRYMD